MLNLIESRIDLEADSDIMEALHLVSKWKQSSHNDEIKRMSSLVVSLTVYISKLRLEKAAAYAQLSQERSEKNKAKEKLRDIWKI